MRQSETKREKRGGGINGWILILVGTVYIFRIAWLHKQTCANPERPKFLIVFIVIVILEGYS